MRNSQIRIKLKKPFYRDVRDLTLDLIGDEKYGGKKESLLSK